MNKNLLEKQRLQGREGSPEAANEGGDFDRGVDQAEEFSDLGNRSRNVA